MGKAHATQSQVATPVLSVSAGSSTSNVTVTITDATAGASLYYTTNGISPATTNSSLSSGQNLILPRGTTLKVQGYLGTDIPSTIITATYTAPGALSAGGLSTLALKNDGSLWAWGNNSSGQLGLGSGGGTNVSQPAHVTFSGVGAMPILGLISKSIAYDNGLSVPWEITYFGATGNNPYSNSSAGDGYTFLQESQLGRSPLDYYQTVAPVVQIVGGNNQTGPSGSILPQPLVIQILTGSGLAQSNAPVLFSVSGGGSITSGTNTNQSSIALRTDGGGLAQVTCQLPTGTSGTNQISVTAGLAQSVSFTESISTTNVPAITFQITGTNVAPATLSFSSIITSPSSVTNVSYYEGGTLLGSGTTTPYSLTISNVTAGLHIYSSIAQNSGGYTGATNVNYTVTVPTNSLTNSQFQRNFGSLQLTNYVISVDGLQGVGLPETNSTNALSSNSPWFAELALPTVYQFTQIGSVTNYTTSIQNPMAAFGAAGGGTPLYTGQTYTFAFCEGGQLNGTTNFTVYTNAATNIYNAADFQILVYNKSNFTNGATNVAAVYTNYFSLPQQGTTNWDAFAQNGYVFTNTLSNSNGYSLITTVQYNLIGSGQYIAGSDEPATTPFIITHSSTNAQYYYVVNYRGVTYDNSNNQYPLTAFNATNASNTVTYNYGYTLDFTNRLAWSSTSLNIPNFQGQPLPAAYAGMSLDELLQVSTPVTNQLASSNITSTNFTALDNSPELRTNPVLNKFVSDMGSNPIILANYVLNQIHLCDAISYNAAGSVSDTSINEGGMNRSALATFLEGEGNPVEQCSLLIYFLRQCGVPCAYVFPNQDTLQMLDARMSSLLHFQLSAALTNTNNSAQILPVNYPWVVAYDSGSSQWVHIFPWMKDTQITEGENLSGYMPAGYQSGLQWVQHYLTNDPAIMNLNTNDDSLRVLYPLYVNQVIASNGLTTNEVGVSIVDRPHNYNSWSNFPQPWGMATNSSNGLSASNFITSLGSTNLIPNLGAATNIFNTITVSVYSDQSNNGVQYSNEPVLNTGTLRMVDLHNRQLLISTASSANNTNTLTLSLEPLRPGTTNTEAFPTNGTMINPQSISTNLTSADNLLEVQVSYSRNRQLSTNSNLSGAFLGVYDTQNYAPGQRPLLKGDAAVLCLDYGQVTQAMIDADAQKFWTAQQSGTMTTNTAIGTQLQLMGMSYYKHCSDLRQEIEPLHKANAVSFFGAGLSKLVAERTSNNILPSNGAVNLTYPGTDMFFQDMAYVGNETTYSASGVSKNNTFNDIYSLFAAGGSAEEHVILNQFYNLSNSASTVHLLHDAIALGKTNIILTSDNFATQGTNNYVFNGVTNSLQTWATESGMWGSISSALTQGAISVPTITFSVGSNYTVTFDSGPYNGSTLSPGSGSVTITPFTFTDGTNGAILVNGVPYTNTGTNTITLSQTNYSGNLTAPYNVVYITPGPIACAPNLNGSNSYAGMGAFILNNNNGSSSIGALISGSSFTNPPLFGGHGASPSTNSSWSTVTNIASNGILTQDADGYSLAMSASSTTAPAPDNGNNTLYGQAGSLAGISAGTITITPDYETAMSQYFGSSTISLSGAQTKGIILTNASTGWMGAVTSWLGNAYGTMSKAVADPVDVIRGSFYVNDTDLTIPGPMPIEFSRHYDSFDLANNEFGTGWKMGYFAYLATNGLTNSTLIYAAEMDGSVIAYSPKSGSTNIWIPAASNNPSLCNMRGDAIGSTANPFNNQIFLTNSGSTTNYILSGADGSIRTFAVTNYPIVSGTNTIPRQRPYLTTWKDAQGNTLSFSFGSNTNNTDYGFLNRITAGNGNFLQLDYNAYGHIISANAADGRLLTYGYDNYGDLISVTRPDSSVISYSYQHAISGTNSTPYSTHLITQENKPEGRVLTNAYDGYRRVVTQGATVGPNNSLIQNAGFTYSTNSVSYNTPITGNTAIQDADHGTTTYYYANSQLTTITDQNAHPIQMSWYQAGDTNSGHFQSSLASKTDKRGLTTAYVYDAYGNPVTITTTGTITGSGSSDTAVTTITYNGNNLPTHIALPNGNYQTITYSGSFPYRPTAIKLNAASGGLIQETDNAWATVGTLGQIPYAAGVLASTSTGIPGTADLVARSFTYNANGFPASETDSTGTSDPSLTTRFTYNLRGQLIQKTDSIGRVTQESYDDLGNRIWEKLSDQSGNAVDWHTWYYGPNGDLEWTQGARFNPADITENIYDAGGRLNQNIVWTSQASGSGVSQKDQATTTYTHDGYGNVTQMLDPLGHATTLNRDPVGQLLSSVTAGVTDSYGYTAGGDVAAHTNPAGGVTTTSFTQTGQPLSQTKPDGTVTTWTYRIDGRPSTISYPDGSSKSFSYNDAAHSVTTTWTSGSGTITESQATDSRGNVISHTDGNGYTTTASYDGLNRLKSSTGPGGGGGAAQRQERHVYDAAGVTDTMTDAAGEVIVTTHDAIGRPTSVTVSQGGSLIRSHATSYSPDHQSVTTTEGNNTAVTTTYTDFAGKPVLIKKADGGSIIASYDDNENLTSTTDELVRTTSFAYDALNRRVSQTLPDGANITFGYDGLGDLTSRAMAGVITWTASYDTAGRETAEALTQSGNSPTRTSSYSYNGNGVAGAGKIASMTDPRSIVSSFSYDGFSRPSQMTASDSVAGLTQNFSYDNDNQLLQVAQSYQSTNNPSSLVKRTYDPYGAIATEQVFVSGVLKDTWVQSHDALGHRTSLTELNNPSLPYTFTYRGDGMLTATTFNGGSYSYGYGSDGFLYSRSTPVQSASIGRDSMGRLLSDQQSALGGVILNESLSYRLDGTQAGYSASRSTNVNGYPVTAWNESRAYGYDLRSHLTSETFAPASASINQNIFQYDGNATGGLGLRTQEGLYTGTNGGTPIGVLNETYPNFARLNSFQATGSLTSSVGSFSTNTINTYDGAGELATRVPNTGSSGANDTMTYDALGRLIGVARTGGSNFTWSAVYDGLGRRLQTTQGSLVIQSSFDPEVEFMEVAVTVAGQRNWFVHGPDLNGVYGGMQGTGGTEAVYNPGNGINCPVINDAYGDSVASIASGVFVWNPVRSTGYGPMWGSTPAPVNGSYVLGTLLNWRGHYVDAIGSYHLGVRDYQYPTGTFTTADPYGHAASMDLYQFCNGDPVNNFDPTGRFATTIQQTPAYQYGANGVDNLSFTASMISQAPSSSVAWNTVRTIPGSIASGDMFMSYNSIDQVQQQSGGSLPSVISVNGLFPGQNGAQQIRSAVQSSLSMANNTVYPMQNPSTFGGLGDLTRAVNEQSGGIDIVALRTAQVLNASAQNQHVGVFAYSNGTAVVQAALNYVSQSSRANISYVGLNGQANINQGAWGLGSAMNVRTSGDVISGVFPAAGSQWNATLPDNPFNPIQDHLFKNTFPQIPSSILNTLTH